MCVGAHAKLVRDRLGKESATGMGLGRVKGRNWNAEGIAAVKWPGKSRAKE